MPQKGKATARSTKKGKTLRKSTRTVSYDSESSGQEDTSLQEAVKGLTTMMAKISTRMDAMDGGSRKKRWVAFRDPVEDVSLSADEAVPAPAARRSAAPPIDEEEDYAAAGPSHPTRVARAPSCRAIAQ